MKHKRLKILYTIPNFETAGSGKVVYDLVKHLNLEYFEPEICCFHSRGAFYDEVKSLGFKMHTFNFAVPYRPYISLPFRVLKIARFFKKHRFDIIHSWHWSSDITEPLAAKLAGIPFIYTKKAMGWGNKAWCWRSALSSKIVTVNFDMQAFFKGRLLKKVISIPFGVDTEYYCKQPKRYETPEGIVFKKTDFVILSVVNFIPVKGIEFLIEAFDTIGDKQMKLCFVGDSSNVYGQKMQALARMNPNIYFFGKQQDVRPYHALADVFVIPTRRLGEGLPMAPIEAMASGLFVIGSRVSGIKDVLKPFDDCMFDPDDVMALKEKLIEIKALSEQEKVSLKGAMQAHVKHRFSLTAFIGSHETLYKEVVV
ncbi:glycosyltransferase [Snuella lapsa]|uniref:Glycosyltransferase n=1 Tax=Snuella lapsa TaxID=870481 RepID=A0ABP6XST6_9FLAO